MRFYYLRAVTGTQKNLVFGFGLCSQKTQNPNPNPDPKTQKNPRPRPKISNFLGLNK
jgi:hypothetical protein